MEAAAKQNKVSAPEPVSQNKLNYERKKQIDAKLRKVDKEIQRLEDTIGQMEQELATLDDIMSHPDQHPEVKVDNELFWSYGKKKEALQQLMDQWGEKQLEREDIVSEYD